MQQESFDGLELIESFTRAWNSVPGARILKVRRECAVGPRHRIDALVDVLIGDRERLLLVEAKRNAYPRDAREAIWQLRGYESHLEKDGACPIDLVLIADAISPGARELLRDEGIGYYDRGGSLYLPAEGAYVFIDKPPPKDHVKKSASIFKGRKEQVLRVLYARGGDWIGVKEIAQASDTSAATVSETLSELERREWVEVRGNGPAKLRKLINKDAMLDAWLRAIAAEPAPKLQRFYAPIHDVDYLAQAVGDALYDQSEPYALTGELAAQHYSPHLTSVSQVVCRALPGSSQGHAAREIGARPVTEGWNLAFINSEPGDFVDSNRSGSLSWASPLQVYLDLQRGTGRAKELADHLRREVLG